jgi:WD40 repeat protein
MTNDRTDTRFELSHDAIARMVFDKASADAQQRRKIEKYIRDKLGMHREGGTLLSTDDLEYIRPYRSIIHAGDAEREFVRVSERAARRKRYALWGLTGGIIVVLAGFSAVTAWQRGVAKRLAVTAQSRQLSMLATNALSDSRFVVSALLAAEAAILSPALESRSALLSWFTNMDQRIHGFAHGHTAAVYDVAFSPDGQTLASASRDGAVILRDVARRQPLGEPLRRHTNPVFGVAFSPDGQTLASAGGGGTVILWDVARRQPLGDPLRRHTDAVYGVAFSPDGQTLASASRDRTVILWDTALQSWISRACAIVGRNFSLAEWRQYIGAESETQYRRTCPEWPSAAGALPSAKTSGSQ